jgi:hypothetical protein
MTDFASLHFVRANTLPAQVGRNDRRQVNCSGHEDLVLTGTGGVSPALGRVTEAPLK